MSKNFLIIGAGQAATQAAATLRQKGFDGTIGIIGAERELPYQRPPLSKKYLAGELDASRLHLRPASYYAEHGIDLVLGQRVQSLDLRSKRVRLEGGRELAYDGLLLTTGSRPRRLEVPGAELAGIHYLRTIADADGLRGALDAQAPIVIVGGGYIGLEVAAVAVRRGLEVTVVEGANRVMSRVVSAEVSRFYEACHRAAGVRIVCNAAVERIDGAQCAEAVVTGDGRRFECGTVIVAVGIEPRTELAREAGIAVANGIRVDELARTSVPDIVAAGDCTNLPSALYERRIRLESVHNAIEQAKTAALTLLGEQRPYSDVPWFWSDQYALKLQIAGLSQGHDRTILRGDPAEQKFALFYLCANRLIAVDAINSPREFIAGKKLIGARAEVAPELLRDPETDLSAIETSAG